MGADLDPLASIAAERPRLMATQAAIGRTKSLLERNDTLQRWQKAVAAQADFMLTLPPLSPEWQHDQRETGTAPLPTVRPPQSTDGPASALDIARLFCLRIQTLAITWLLSGDARYRERAKQELLAVCAFPDCAWAGDEFLVTAEMAFGAAIGFDWLYEALDPGERAQVVRAIVDKAIQPGLDEFAAPAPPAPNWTTVATNWNLVCNGALMIAALAVLESDKRAAHLFALCRASVAIGFSEFRPDGGWTEGPGYWHYACQYAIYLLDSLDTALGTDLGLDRRSGISRTGFFRLHAMGPSGKLFNFADSEEKHSGGYWLLWLGKRYHHPVDAFIEEQRAGKSPHPMDLLWFDENAHNRTRLPIAKRFRGTEVFMLRGDWRDAHDTTYLGIKAGANNAHPRHAHYDLGSFVLDAGGHRWAIDLGPDDYHLKDYFLPEMRSRYYRTSTIGHNTLVIDDRCQPYAARALVVGESFRAKLSLVVLDLSAAYPSTARAWRGFALVGRRDIFIVDEIVPLQPLSSVDWQMHSGAQIALGDPVVTLTQAAKDPGDKPSQYYLRFVDSAAGKVARASATPLDPPGQNANEDVAKIVLHVEPAAQPLRLAAFLSPCLTACTSPDLPPVLQRPLCEWIQPTGVTRRR